MFELNKFIRTCFRIGFSNKEIIQFLALSEKVVISISTLKRRMKSMGLFRRKNHDDLLDVVDFLLNQQGTSRDWWYLVSVRTGVVTNIFHSQAVQLVI